MPALNEIIAGKPGTSLLASSSMWTQPVESIIPAQLVAFIDRHAQLGKRDEAESAVELTLAAITRAVGMNLLPAPQMLSYHRPNRIVLTSTEVKNGMLQLGTLKSAAVVFALETGMDSVAVSRLTHRSLAEMRRTRELTPVALECLNEAPPRHVALQYVFWEDSDNGFPLPLFGLEADVFQAFGLIWAELVEGYANLVIA